uniref:Uncharacterized protein n=1 Tax=Chromera velia CCMP2878 TaxID=1169474 RepID=A0A0G4IDX2_9ALVE|eukprot:Cvel_13559.t1-p1 / transcript=Cvel_13559.t1 / gene=Cvel_13559 / organism=Chromera_velia_CCMP2878 / gene_product=Serine/threonine-protein phosphatase 6 regulatory, putative / transcript_product=Serine/threonine-protein phosphatase 6 regulatory, putative / location=Cvel_scaffold931:49456-50868(+) / protein_length=471 / sequence_SO=supercontig / SO=protein_coding / is_pseudo=false
MSVNIDPVIQGVESLEQAFDQVLQSIRHKKNLLVKLKEKAQADSASASSTAPSSAPLPQEAAALTRLQQLIQHELPDLRKSCHAELDQIIGCNYKIDLSPLFACGIDYVIRSFQPLSAQTLCSALDSFTERRQMHNFRLCLTVGAQLDGSVDGQSALLKAVWTMNFAGVRLLADAGAGLEVKSARPVWGVAGRTALHLACCKRSPEIANFLISRGANVKAEDSKKYTPLHIAASEGLTDVIVSLLSHGADVNAKSTPGDTALHRASYKGQRGAAELLLDRGAHVDERGTWDRTPLHGTLAPCGRQLADHSDVAQLLISRGADVNARVSNGVTVLQHAAAWGSADVAEVVVSAGADLHLTDDTGATALHHAVRRTSQMNRYAVDQQKKNRIVRMLVSNGINTHVRNNSGRTALDLARQYLLQDSEICSFLGIFPHHSSSSSSDDDDVEEVEGGGEEEEEEEDAGDDDNDEDD